MGAWATGGNANTARRDLGGAGTQTAGLMFGGQPPPTGVGNTESYNGTNWTEVNDLQQARNGNAGSGTSTSALTYGGLTTTYVSLTESWNGTNWTEVNDLNTSRGY